MTVTADPLAGTQLELATLPEGLVGFGVAEVGFLLSLHPGETTTTSRAFLGLDERLVTDEVLTLSGASSLVARGMLTAQGERLQTRSSAALLEVALGQTVRWIRVGILAPDDSLAEVVFFLQTPSVSAVVEPAATVTWWTRFGEPDDDPGPLIAALAESRLAREGSSVIVDVMNGGEGGRRNLLLAREDAGLVGLVDVTAGGEGGTLVDVTDLAATIRTIVPAVTA